MAYLLTTDLKGFLDERELAALKRDYEADGTDKLLIGITYAENYVADRLGAIFSISAEYAKSGTARSTTLLEILAHIAIWKVAATFPTITLEGKRFYFYETALKDLDKIARGELAVNLSPLTETPSVIRWGESTETEIIY